MCAFVLLAWLAAFAAASGIVSACGSPAPEAGNTPFARTGPPGSCWKGGSASSCDSGSDTLRSSKKRAIGLGADSAAGRGRGRPLSLATQNTQGLSETKLSWLVEQKHDILALTENQM